MKSMLLVLLMSAHGSVIWRGVDMSQLSTEDHGGDEIFSKSPQSAKQPALALMHDAGLNAFRMRVWNSPPTGYEYANVTGLMSMARRAKAHGLDFIVDFHYSDWWADPGHQTKPAAWESLSLHGLGLAVYNFTKSTIDALVEQGTPPQAIQIGNEVTVGMLWAPTGQPCSNGGYLGAVCGSDLNWPSFVSLVKQGIAGAKAACPSALIAIHTDLGNHIQKGGIGYVIDWYKNLSSYGADYDLVGLSMYPQWDDGETKSNLGELSKLGQSAFMEGKGIYIAETAYPADGNKQFESAYPATAQGQCSFLQMVFDQLQRALPSVAQSEDQNSAFAAGVLWWEGGENGWNSLFYEANGTFIARPALLEGFK